MLVGVLCATSGVFAQQPVADSRATEVTRRMAEDVLTRPVTVNLDRVPLKVALRVMSQRAGVRIQSATDVLDAVAGSVTVHAEKMPLGKALDRVLEKTGLRVVVLDWDLVEVAPFIGSAAHVQGTITGKVVDAQTKRPLRDVKIAVDGTDRAVTADDGVYRVTTNAGDHTVAVKLLGYRRIAKHVVIQDNAVTTIDVALDPTATALDQVVVTGTVVQTELKAVPNAITVITAKQIEERGITHIDQLFRGDVPGVFSQAQGSESVLGAVTMYVRGATAFPNGRSAGTDQNTGTTNPIKTYVDGVELADPKYLSQIDPRSIERIEILTGPQASTIYGSNALNGVMQIFTKRGTSNTPQLTLDLESGWIENSYSSAHAPQHSANVQLSGIEGKLSYHAGGSWNYRGPWTPGLQSTSTSGFGGVHAEWHTPGGPVTADATLRRTVTQDLQRGDVFQTYDMLQAIGYTDRGPSVERSAPQTHKADGQTFGLTVEYQPWTWWSHELALGQDVQSVEVAWTAPGYYNGSDGTDSLLTYDLSQTQRQSVRYATSVQAHLVPRALFTATIGADAWRSLSSEVSAQPTTLTGALANSTVSRTPTHNTGGFFQTQLGISDQLFLTYGIRAEWNPGFGRDIQPNWAPRYGVAYTQDLGTVTAKLRASFGRATRPPRVDLVRGFQITPGNDPNGLIPYFGPIWLWLPNPGLLPEHQQGGEGGLEVYLGTRGSLVITRYNQTVDNLIELPQVDSVSSLLSIAAYGRNPSNYASKWPDGYFHWPQREGMNVGSIRNQGWELQNSLNLGPFMIKGTYSFTKSRVLGITPKFRAQFSPSRYPDYQPGSTFQYVAEHTWAASVAYTHQQSTILLNVNGIGQLLASTNTFDLLHFGGARLLPNRYRMSAPSTYRYPQNGYALADVNASQRFSPHMEGVLQVQNLMNYYQNDLDAGGASIGRQVKAGIRLRF